MSLLGISWVVREFGKVAFIANQRTSCVFFPNQKKKKKKGGVIISPMMLPSYNSKPTSWEVLSNSYVVLDYKGSQCCTLSFEIHTRNSLFNKRGVEFRSRVKPLFWSVAEQWLELNASDPQSVDFPFFIFSLFLVFIQISFKNQFKLAQKEQILKLTE